MITLFVNPKSLEIHFEFPFPLSQIGKNQDKIDLTKVSQILQKPPRWKVNTVSYLESGHDDIGWKILLS